MDLRQFYKRCRGKIMSKKVIYSQNFLYFTLFLIICPWVFQYASFADTQIPDASSFCYFDTWDSDLINLRITVSCNSLTHKCKDFHYVLSSSHLRVLFNSFKNFSKPLSFASTGMGHAWTCKTFEPLCWICLIVEWSLFTGNRHCHLLFCSVVH